MNKRFLNPNNNLTATDYAFSLLRSYIAIQNPQYDFGAHHLLICKKLEAVERGEIKRLMIFMPPRHGKSMIISEYFPAWYLGRNPSKKIIAASYGAELAQDFGRKVRNQFRDTTWQAVFPNAQLDKSSAASDRVNLEQGGSYYAVGAGGALTGRGADILIVDDPIKSREDADSAIIRKHIKDWYASTAYTRLMPDGAVIIVQTRWHEDDLAGWLLDTQSHEQWDVVSLPALATGDNDILGRRRGEALWPKWYSQETLEQIRKTIGVREWNALYQQHPVPDEGAFFKREWFEYYDTLPKEVKYYGASDYAVTENNGDFTVHIVVAVDDRDNIYLVDMWRGQTTSLLWIEHFIGMIKMYHPQIWAEEAGVIMKSLAPIIETRLMEEKLYCTSRQQFASATDKATRARSLQARMQMGKFFFPNPQTHFWMHELIDEFCSFPAGKHDDQVDACSLVCRLLTQMTSPHPASAHVISTRPQRTVWR